MNSNPAHLLVVAQHVRYSAKFKTAMVLHSHPERRERVGLDTVTKAFSVVFNTPQTDLEFPRFLGSISTFKLVAGISRDSCALHCEASH